MIGFDDESDGPETQDYVFLISNMEIKKYLKNGKDSIVLPINGADEELGYLMQWWTRTPGENYCSASFVSENGYIDDSGLQFDDGSLLIRPAMWISL